MKTRHVIGILLVSAILALGKVWQSRPPEEPARGGAAGIEDLYQAEGEAVLKMRAQQQKPGG